jgi:hypothetical protein
MVDASVDSRHEGLSVVRRGPPPGFDAVAQPYDPHENMERQAPPARLVGGGRPAAGKKKGARSLSPPPREQEAEGIPFMDLTLAGRFGKVELECSALIQADGFLLVDLPARGFKWSPPEATSEDDFMAASSEAGGLTGARLLSMGAEFDRGAAGRTLIFIVME